VRITSERLPESRVLLEIEVDNERLEKAMNQAYRRVVNRARIPGFRPGKAPRAMVERYLGRETLLSEALDRLVPEVYEEALEQEGIDAIDRPELEMPQTDPVIVKATVPVRPKIDLGDYRSIRIDPEATTVDGNIVDQTIDQLQHRYATVEPVDRPVEQGDIVRVDLKTTADGEVYFDHKDAEFAVTPEDTANLPELASRLIGMSRGDQKSFSVDVPEDATGTTLAGKHVEYEVQIHEIKVEHLPELNDEFAGMVGEGYPTMEALRAKLQTDATERAENEARRRFEQKALDALVAGTTYEYPTVLVEREIDRAVRENSSFGNDHAALHRYLEAIGKTEEEYREGFRGDAVERVKRSLALSQFTDEEGIVAGEEEVNAEIEKMAADSGSSSERIRELFGGDSGREVIERSLLTRRAYERLADIAEGKPVPPKPETEPATNEATATELAESEQVNNATAEPEESTSEVSTPVVPAPESS
jgi:trigger factor